MIWFVEGVLSGIEKFTLVKNLDQKEQSKIMLNHVFLTDYLPLGSMSNLIPSPLVRTNMAKMFGMEFKFEYPIDSVVACIIWSMIFIAGSYWILKKKDW